MAEPDRIAVDPKSAFHRADLWRYDVYLDGERVGRVLEACVSGGWVLVLPLPAGGFKGKKALREIAPARHSGKVEIRLREAGQ